MSVNGLTGCQSSTVTGFFAMASQDVFAGLVTSIMSIAYGLSFAALIFAPPLTPWIAYGIAATFLTSAVSAAIVAARSSLPFAIAGPDGATAAVTASLVAALIERLIAEGAPDDLLAPVMIVLALTAALTGILLCGLGLARAGGAIRFVPYPVIGGFLGATGWLMVSGAVRVITDHPLGLSTLELCSIPLPWQSSRRRSPLPLLSISPCAAHAVPSCCRPSCSPALPSRISPSP